MLWTCRNTIHISLAALTLAIGGCAAAPERAESVENPAIYTPTEADLVAVGSTEPISADTAVLYVNGLGCPLCATNVDKQLLRLRGLNTAQVDLAAGTVTVGLVGDRRPSPAAIGEAVRDAGFTLVRIQTR